MCGISGWYNIRGEGPDRSTLDLMLDALHHRGPNERGRFHRNEVALAMTRLSINDIDGGGQPYFNEDRSIVAVFNGEIYNFRELRAGLESTGHQFRSQTDGEVIVHLWEEYGAEFVKKLNGMFAIALWDGRALHLFRDRFGIKPLYYTYSEGTYYFASELKGLLSVPGFSRKLDHHALKDYLSLEYVPSPRSIYETTKKLSPAHGMSVTSSGVGQPRRYWDFPRFSADGSGTLQDWAERLRYELKESVRRRLLADVPLGVFLSGGLDSSAITALMAEIQPGRVESFSVGFSEKTFDESSYAQMVSERVGTVHHQQMLDSKTTLDIIDPLYAQLDEPMADAALIPTYLLSKFASTKVTVALAGEGADELLGGYPTYLAHQVSQAFNWLPSPLLDFFRLMTDLLPTSREYMSLDFKIKRFSSGLGLEPALRHFTWMGSIPPRQVDQYLLNPVAEGFKWVPKHDDLSLVEQIQELDFHTYLAEDLLVKLDRATMLTSLEGRVPYLDHTLVESMAALPTRFKLQLTNAKRTLKLAMATTLPEPVLHRSKKGFGIPLGDWLRGPLRFLLDEYLRPEYLKSQGLFRVEPIQKMVAEHLQGKADRRKPLWTLLVFQRWWQQYRPT